MTPARKSLLLSWLIVALAALASLAVAISTHSVTTAEFEARSAHLLKVFRPDELERLTVERGLGAARERYSLERKAGAGEAPSAWRIAEPFDEEAKQEAVDAYFTALRYAAFERVVPEAQVDRKALGLDTPRLVVHLKMGLVNYRLRVANPAPQPPDSSYLELSGEGVSAKGIYVVRNTLIEELDVSVGKFRGNRLVPYGKSELGQIRATYAELSYLLERKEQQGWRLSVLGGPSLRAKRDVLDAVFLQLARLELRSFLPLASAEDAVKAELPLRLELLPEASGRKAAHITVGGPCPDDANGRVAYRSAPEPLFGCVPSDAVEALLSALPALADNHLFALHADEVASLRISHGAERLELARSKDGFALQAPKQGEAPRELVNARLQALLELSGDRVATPASSLDFGSAPFVIEIHGAEDVPSELKVEKVSLLAEDEHGISYALRHQDGAVFQLRGLEPELLDVSAALLRSPQLLEYAAREIELINVVSSEMKQVLERRGDTFVLKEPSGYALDNVLALETVDALRSLRATRWVTDRYDGSVLPSFGLEPATASVNFQVRTKAGLLREHQLTIGARTTGGNFASLDRDGIFVMARSVVEQLLTLALDRSVFAFPETAHSIELETRTERVVLDRRGGEFQPGPDSPRLTRAQVNRLLEALKDVRAEAAVHDGPALSHEGFARPLLTVRVHFYEGKAPFSYAVGAGDVFRDAAIYYARSSSSNATFAIARQMIERITDEL